MDENGKRNALKKSTVLHNGKRNYTIVDVLGAGGFGITYRAEGLVDNIPMTFAVKEFFMSGSCERVGNDMCYSNPVKAQVEAGKKSFFSEARRLNDQKVYHSNLVRINEAFEENNTAYYVMEYIPGKNLRRHFTKPCGEQMALEIMRHVLDALATLHAHKITHLDIKPDNILLKTENDGNVRPVVIDLGLSKHYSDKGSVTSKLLMQACSLGYSPMEQYDGDSLTHFTPQADVYAAAATLFFLLTGKDPKKASMISRSWIEQELPATVSDRTRRAIVAAMQARKDDRTQSVSDFAEQLGLELGAGGPNTVIITPGPKFDWEKIKKLLLGALGAAIVVALAVLAVNNLRECSKKTDNPVDTTEVKTDTVKPVDSEGIQKAEAEAAAKESTVAETKQEAAEVAEKERAEAQEKSEEPDAEKVIIRENPTPKPTPKPEPVVQKQEVTRKVRFSKSGEYHGYKVEPGWYIVGVFDGELPIAGHIYDENGKVIYTIEP